MVKVILSGYNGKMGKTILNILSNFPNINIAAGIDKNTFDSTESFPVFNNIKDCNVEADVILDFSRPDSLKDLTEYCIANKLSLVLCTTGYSKEEVQYINDSSKIIPMFRSGNMSIGINVINSVLKNISAFLYTNYDIEIIEKHHNQKVDAPSGTALLLADTIKASIPEETEYVYGREGNSKRQHKEIGIHAIRGGSIVGEHDVIFAGQGELIEIRHTALSREVFAVGALKASEFMYNKAPGLYNMDDVLKK